MARFGSQTRKIPDALVSSLTPIYALQVAARLRADSVEPAHSTPDEFGRFIADEIAKWSKVIKAGNIKVD